MTEQRVLEVSREIDSTPEAVFHSLTHALELSYWFCHQAWSDPRPGGDFQARWRNGWWARGVFQMVERPWRVELTWQGRDEPGETEVVFQINALDQGTEATVIHRGFGADAVWEKAVLEAESSWPRALENLESVLTSGIDLRVASSPVLGIVPIVLTSERASKEGISTERGIYLVSVLEDGGAADAGLRRGDVITSIGGMAVRDLDSLATTLARYRIGDRAQVTYVRGAERGSFWIELMAQSFPEIAFDPSEVVAQAREQQAAELKRLREAVTDLTEPEAEKKPSSDDWSVKETLAHLSLNERFTQAWFADIIVGTTPGQSGGNPTVVPEALAMTLSGAPSVENLIRRLESDKAETLALFTALRPEVSAMKARFREMASWLLTDHHTQVHVAQIKATVDAVRG